MRIRAIAPVAVLGLFRSVLTASSSAQGAAVPGVVHFTAVGDFGSTVNTSAVLGGLAAADPDLTLALGDLSYGGPGSEPGWCDFVTSRAGAGAVGLTAYLSGSVTNTPLTLRLDDVSGQPVA